MNTKTHVVTIRLTTDDYNVLHGMAKKDDVPLSIVIRRSLRKGLGLPETAKVTAQDIKNAAKDPVDALAEKITESWE